MTAENTRCGLHIAQALAGLSLEQICRCDDDQDSEHSWASITSPNTKRTIPRYPIPFNTATSSASSSSAASNLNTPLPGSSASESKNRPGDPVPHCIDPSPVEYKLSKISATSATEAALRKAQQAAALEELKKIKEQQQMELKNTNQVALDRLLSGLSQASTDGTETHDIEK
ncbi:hypothetical protein BGZ76_002574 [Entomortierella beljakovae]|nr:hypothetical protein BGZ76_002574 [Entomortierella beljakovae]